MTSKEFISARKRILSHMVFSSLGLHSVPNKEIIMSAIDFAHDFGMQTYELSKTSVTEVSNENG